MRMLILATALAALASVPARGAVAKKAIDAAIERGVAYLRGTQQDDGSWSNTHMGATALAGLTLLECGVERDDRAVKAAAAYVRKQGLENDQIYSLSLAVVFLDRLGEPTDTPLIESMIVRILAGQLKNGAWSYTSPKLAPEELKRILGEMDGSRVLRAGGDLKKMPERGKRTFKDLPESIQAQIALIDKLGGAAPVGFAGDNSNTQFAVIGLWAGRRYGVPTQAALVKAADHFRATQLRDGSWAYVATPSGYVASTATMTCAGVLGLAVGTGAAVELKKARGGKADSADVSKDASLKAGLTALGTSVGKPLGWDGLGPRPAAASELSGKAFYYLWSLERICVALGLRTIGKKDWYNWGAELLLANQQHNGSWNGEYAAYKADTCFALLFLKRADLTDGLGTKLAGLRDPGEKILKAGGVGGEGLKGSGTLPASGIGEKKPGTKAEEKPKDKPRLLPPATTAAERGARELAEGLSRARAEDREGMIRKLRDTKGVAYTEALAWAIGGLEGEAKKEARQALTLRLSRMTDATLGDYLADDDAEVRRAAALALGTKGSKAHLGGLVRLMRDGSSQVRRAAQAALKELTGKDLGPEPAPWEKWWKDKGRE